MRIFFKRFLRKIPLLAGLADCRLNDHKMAAIELCYILLGSLLPFFIGGVLILLMAAPPPSNYVSYFFSGCLDTMKHGELLLCSASLLAPIIYLATISHNEGAEFPTKNSHLLVVISLLVISAAIFGFMRAQPSINEDTLFITSTAIFMSSVFLLYLAITYKHRITPKGPDDMKNQEKDFSMNYASHRG